MKFDIYCAGTCRDEGEFAQVGACGYVLAMTDQRGIRLREFGFALGGSDTALAEVQAVRLALASIAPAYRTSVAVIHTTCPLVAETLSSDADPSDPKTVRDLRRFFGFYPAAEVVLETEPSPYLVRARQLAKLGVETQKDFDSGTFDPKGGPNAKV